jgi:RNA polymerase sigma factor (sigma-70 family)
VVAEEQEISLIARAMRRDSEAFTALYNRYFERIYRYARLRLDSLPDAEDVTHGVFLNAWRAIDRFSPKHEASFAAWLFRLAHNAIVDRYRHMQDTLSLEETPSMLIPDEPIADPELNLEWRLTLQELHQALQTLTDEQREVVLLRFVEGLSAREVGDILGKQEGTVRGMQFRALEALRRTLTPAREGGAYD